MADIEIKMKNYFVYILTNYNNNVMYIGVTGNLEKRIYEHKNKIIAGFTQKYNVDKLVYYETYSRIEDAIAQEKRLKGWKRERKNKLVETINNEWVDLSSDWYK